MGRVEVAYIEDEMRESYINYAMSVILGRAIPDVRDGLKPVQRRILYGMYKLGLSSGKPHRKAARIVGETMGKYHPHGDQAIYDALVNMAQEFSFRYPLIDGQGNFGCFTGETKIKLLDGTEKSFGELAKLPPDEVFYVYSIDRSGRIVVGEGRNARITRHNAPLMELTLDSGEMIRCTPDHRFLLRDGTYKQAKDLTPDDPLMPGYFDTAPVKEGLNDYLQVKQPRTGEWGFVHHLADEFNERRGRAPQIEGPFVRHHKDFNRWNNSPDNIERMSFLEHLHLHAARIVELWEDEEFRAKQRQGAQRYYQEHPEAKEARRQRIIRQNRSEEFRALNGRRVAEALHDWYREHPEKRKEISQRMKALWTDPEYRRKTSEALTGIEKRPLSPEQKERVAQIISEKSRRMWADDEMRKRIIRAITEALGAEEVRRRMSESSKRTWEDPQYRAKFPRDHFVRMAHKLWEKPQTRELHRRKIQRQWEDEEFRRRQREGVRRSNWQRIAQNPEMMKELAEQAAATLRERWSDPAHKQRVMRSKILNYVNGLQRTIGGELTPELYEARRNERWVPSLEKALRYFTSFEEMVQEAETYNHRVVAKRMLEERADVYDIIVDAHHNFLLASGVFVHNSIDGDAPAAMRYTEARLSSISEELLADIEEETVDWGPNFDDSLKEPLVLPAKLPNLLLNGSWGISVGMTTQIPPHNLGEVIDALVYLLRNPEAPLEELMRFIKGPDFPTGGIIVGREEIERAYRTGGGRILIRARAAVEDERIIISEIPYQVRKSTLMESIARKVRDGELAEIADLRDESDRRGLRIVIELKRGANPKVLLGKLYKATALEWTFGAHFLVIVNGQPRRLPLRGILKEFLTFRRAVVRRRTKHRLREAERRAEILEGLLKTLERRGEVVEWIGAAQDANAAQVKLQAELELTELQAAEILRMRLRQFTALERERLHEEFDEVRQALAEFREILESSSRLDGVIEAELLEMKEQYGDPRRTELALDSEIEELDLEELIPDEDLLVTISERGYANAPREDIYRRQNRGGKGVIGMRLREGDHLRGIFTANSRDWILLFTDAHKVYRLRAFQLPSLRRDSKGENLRSFVELAREERIVALLPLHELDPEDRRLCLLATARGMVICNPLRNYHNAHTKGIIALNALPEDEVVKVAVSAGQGELILGSELGRTIRFAERRVRISERPSRGVIGMRLGPGDRLIGMVALEPGAEGHLLFVTERGFGKRTPLKEFHRQGRGGKGVLGIKVKERTGHVMALERVSRGDELLVTTEQGKTIRIATSSIRIVSRYAQGVKLIDLEPGDRVASVVKV